MTRYAERDALHALLMASADPYAEELAEVLERGASRELVAVTPISAANLLPTYETRLEAAGTGVGPHTRGLAEFVAALRDQDIAEMFAVSEGRVTGIGLINTVGDVAAVTLVVGSDSQ